MSLHRLCCCSPTHTCAACAASTAAEQYQVVIDGWTACTGCFDLGTGTRYKIVGDLNGTWTLDFYTFGSVYCIWKVTTDVVLESHSSSSCDAGDLLSSEYIELYFSVTASGGHYYYAIQAYGGGSGQVFLFDSGSIDLGTSAPDCTATDETMANLFDGVTPVCGDAYTSGEYVFGYGGTATVTAI